MVEFEGLSLSDLLVYLYSAQANFCEKTSSVGFNADMAVVCDCAFPGSCFYPRLTYA